MRGLTLGNRVLLGEADLDVAFDFLWRSHNPLMISMYPQGRIYASLFHVSRSGHLSDRV